MFELVELNGKVHQVSGESVTIGRHGCDLEFSGDEQMSREHARIWISANGIRLQDLDSTNGSRVNGDRVSGETHLKQGDIVEVGSTKLFVRISESVAPTVIAPSLKTSDTKPPLQNSGQANPKIQPPNPHQQPPNGFDNGLASSPRMPANPYHQNLGVRPKDRNICIILEILPALLGFFGIGWIYAGRIAVGGPMLFAGMVLGLMALILFLLTGGFAIFLYILCMPIMWFAIVVSAALLHRYTKSNEGMFV